MCVCVRVCVYVCISIIIIYKYLPCVCFISTVSHNRLDAAVSRLFIIIIISVKIIIYLFFRPGQSKGKK